MMDTIVIGNRTFCVEGGATDVNIVLKEIDERMEIYEIAVNFDSPRIPEKIKITTRDAGVDVYSTFDAAHKFRNISFGGAGKFVSRLASWAPFAQTLSKTGKNCALYALDDNMTPIAVSVKIDLDTLFVESETVLFDAVTNPVKSYCVQMRIDRRRIDFDAAVADLYDWYEQKGLRPLPAPRKAFVPMYSTWYSYLQNITAEDVVRECREAVKFGMKAVIIDDGWQTDDASVLYGYTGDWQPSRKKFPDMKMADIYLDSPMGVKTTEIYSEHETLLSRELKEMLASGDDPFEPRGFSFIRTAEESRAINAMDDGIVLAGSGMCSGGRIMHHLKHSLYKKDTHVFFVGYQAYGTLGRRIVDGAKTVRIAGEEISVKAQLHTLNGFSAHADRDDLLRWASLFTKKARFVVVHGEPKSAESLALGLRDAGYSTRIPAIGDEIDLTAPAPEKAAMPEISKRILDRIDFNPKDVESVLNLISERTDAMRETLIKNEEQYRNIMPLLISARTLLETAAALGGAQEEKK